MRSHGLLLIALGSFAGPVRADENEARKLIDAAIVAHGGEAALTKYSVVTVKTEGIFQGYKDRPVFFHKYEETLQGADKFRGEMRFQVRGAECHVVNVLNGKQGWIKQSMVPKSGQPVRSTTEYTPAQLVEVQEGCYVKRMLALVPLKGPEYALALAGEQKEPNTLVGVRVSSTGHRDVTLYFDKQTHLLAKTACRGTAGTDDEGTVETRFGRYEKVRGIQMPISWETWLNERCLFSFHVVERTFAEKAAPDAFAKP